MHFVAQLLILRLQSLHVERDLLVVGMRQRTVRQRVLLQQPVAQFDRTALRAGRTQLLLQLFDILLALLAQPLGLLVLVGHDTQLLLQFVLLLLRDESAAIEQGHIVRLLVAVNALVGDGGGRGRCCRRRRSAFRAHIGRLEGDLEFVGLFGHASDNAVVVLFYFEYELKM